MCNFFKHSHSHSNVGTYIQWHICHCMLATKRHCFTGGIQFVKLKKKNAFRNSMPSDCKIWSVCSSQYKNYCLLGHDASRQVGGYMYIKLHGITFQMMVTYFLVGLYSYDPHFQMFTNWLNIYSERICTYEKGCFKFPTKPLNLHMDFSLKIWTSTSRIQIIFKHRNSVRPSTKPSFQK